MSCCREPSYPSLGHIVGSLSIETVTIMVDDRNRQFSQLLGARCLKPTYPGNSVSSCGFSLVDELSESMNEWIWFKEHANITNP